MKYGMWSASTPVLNQWWTPMVSVWSNDYSYFFDLYLTQNHAHPFMFMAQCSTTAPVDTWCAWWGPSQCVTKVNHTQSVSLWHHFSGHMIPADPHRYYCFRFPVGMECNIPVSLWLLQSYPLHPPMCYIQPTKSSMIVRSENVDGDGKVNLPYLQTWKAVSVFLCELHVRL